MPGSGRTPSCSTTCPTTPPWSASLPVRSIARRRATARCPAFDPYGIPCDDSLDPLLHDLDQMHCELAELEARVARLAEEQMRQRQAAAE